MLSSIYNALVSMKLINHQNTIYEGILVVDKLFQQF